MHEQIRQMFETIGRYNSALQQRAIYCVGDGPYGLIHEQTNLLNYLGFRSAEDAALYRHHLDIMWKPEPQRPYWGGMITTEAQQQAPTYRIICLVQAIDPASLPKVS